ncbi:MAG: hypothetical protein HOC74_16635 [Gemmatimonadetes bacterium]|jgi:hypothetical protein|nr:hypothetical protein [Gemmatimonadota bacterium]
MRKVEMLTKALRRESVDRILTWDYIDNEGILAQFGGYDRSQSYSFDDLIEINARAFKNIGLDMTRGIYDPVNHWMGGKIENWIRFFGVDPGDWAVEQAGGTAWISRRPFHDLKGLEQNMPNPPKFEDVREWFEPFIKRIKEIFDDHDLVWVGGVEGPVCDAYTYTDMELFMMAVFDAPELIAHIMDCTGKFSAYIAQIYAEHATSPLMFMGEDICGTSGPILSPSFLREQAVPRWRWIQDPIKSRGYAFLFHTDGRYGDALPVIFEDFQADGLHPIERNGCNDIYEIHSEYPNKLLFGNVCCAETLPRGNVYDVEDETLELIERLGPDGGIFIGSSSELHDLVPVENGATMYRTVHGYGTYPLDVDKIRARRHEIREKLSIRRN